MINYKDYIDSFITMDNPTDLTKIEGYLQKYLIISEINARFKGCTDFEYDLKLK